MAQPIRLTPPARDPREVLQARLNEAPTEHAEALLAAYEVLQGLHDRGALELVRGMLGSSEEVLEIAVNAAKSPESIRGIRNLIVLVNLLAEIDPEQLKRLTHTVPAALKSIDQNPEPPGLWSLAMQMLWNKDARRGLSAMNAMLEAFGSKIAQP